MALAGPSEYTGNISRGLCSILLRVNDMFMDIIRYTSSSKVYRSHNTLLSGDQRSEDTSTPSNVRLDVLAFVRAARVGRMSSDDTRPFVRPGGEAKLR